MDTSPPSIPSCPHCGTILQNELPEGLCPACLLKRAFETQGGDSGSFVPPTPEELEPFFPALEILELLGCGGMGAVYKARQKQLDRFVALKILSPGISHDPSFAERFAREARALAKLHHPNIVTLYEFGEADGQFYFLMEFVDGLNLRTLLNGGRLAPQEALAIVPQICDALQFAHDRGIVHRDIKPENILLNQQGQVKIADFGVAKIVAREQPLPDSGGAFSSESGQTEVGNVIGTPQYMAPEQISHPQEVDNRADIYALGVVFYQMLTGELPAGKLEPPSRKVQIDVRLDEVVLRALEKEPGLRYASATEFKTRIETVTSATDDAANTPVASATIGLLDRPYGELRDGRLVFFWRKILMVYLTAAGCILLGATAMKAIRGRPSGSPAENLMMAFVCPLGLVLWIIFRTRGQTVPGENKTETMVRGDPHFPPSRTGKILAVIGAILQIGPLMGTLGTVLGMMRAFASLKPNGIADPGQLSTAIGQVLASTMAGMVVGVIGLVLLGISLTALRYRAKWFFWFLVIYSWPLLIAIPVVGTAFGIFFLIYCLSRREEFTGASKPPGRQAIPPSGNDLPTPTYAGFWKRLLAAFVDYTLVSVAVFPFVVTMAVLMPESVVVGVPFGLFTTEHVIESQEAERRNPDGSTTVVQEQIVEVAVLGKWKYLYRDEISHNAGTEEKTRQLIDPSTRQKIKAPTTEIGAWVLMLYWILMESSQCQASIGKMVVGIRVADSQGRRISLARSAGRNAAKLISALTAMIGFLMAGWTGRKQALHDIMADCYVTNATARLPESAAAQSPSGGGLLALGILSLGFGPFTAIPGLIISRRLKPFTSTALVGYILCWIGLVVTIGLSVLFFGFASWRRVNGNPTTRQQTTEKLAQNIKARKCVEITSPLRGTSVYFNGRKLGEVPIRLSDDDLTRLGLVYPYEIRTGNNLWEAWGLDVKTGGGIVVRNDAKNEANSGISGYFSFLPPTDNGEYQKVQANGGEWLGVKMLKTESIEGMLNENGRRFIAEPKVIKPDPGPVTNTHAVRCVFVKNHVDRPISIDLSINSSPAERVELMPKQGLFLYEPVPGHVPFASLEPTQASISGPDGSAMSFTGFSMELAASLATPGYVTAQGWSGAESSYTIPRKEWLDETHLTARLVQNLRRVDATILPNAATSPSAAIQVSVLGSVRRPGSYQLPPGGSLLDAVAAAGGWMPEADFGKISILRQEGGGADAKVEVHNLRSILQGQAINPLLQDRSVVTLSASKF